jgi:hypothetical protein
MMKKQFKVPVLAAFAICLLTAAAVLLRRHRDDGDDSRKEWPPNTAMIHEAGKLVKMKVMPQFDYSFDRMKPGVFQHIDRRYTYDVVPDELIGGLLFQGIHRPPKGTAIEFELLSAAKVFCFFHEGGDGGYGAIFPRLEGWQRCQDHPQYDVHNGNHGLKMVMYRLDAAPGIYQIPATTADRACFNIVFQPSPDFSAKSSR